MPSLDVVENASHEMTMMVLEKGLCMGDRKAFYDMARDSMTRVAEKQAQNGNSEPLERMSAVNISNRDLTDMMLSYLDSDDEPEE
jgi:hypothetical protein